MVRFSLKYIIFALLFASFIFGGSAYSRGESLTVRYLIEEGIYFYEQGLLDEATVEFNKVLSADPDNFTAKEYLTKIRYELQVNDLMDREQQFQEVRQEVRQEARFDQTIGDLSAQAMSLNERNKDLERKLRTLSLDITMLNKSLTEKNQELAEIRSQLLSAESDKAREISNIEGEMLKAQFDKDQELESIRGKLARLEYDKEQEVASVKGELSKLQEEYDKASRECSRSSLKNKLDKVKDTLEDKKKEIVELGKEKKELIREREELECGYQQQADELQAEIGQARQEIEELTNTLKMKNEAIQRREKKIRALREECEGKSSKQELDKLNEKLRIRGSEIKDLTDNLITLQNKYDEEVLDIQKRYEELEKSLDAKDIELNSLRNALEEQEREVERLTQERQTKIDDKERLLRESQEEIGRKQQELNQIKDEVRSLESELEAKESSLKYFQNQLADLQGQNQARFSEGELEARSMEAERLRGDLGAAQGKYEQRFLDCTAKVERLLGEVDSKNQALAEMRASLEGQQERIEALVNEKERLIQEKEDLLQGSVDTERFRKVPIESSDDMIGCREIIMARGDEIQSLELKLANLHNEYERKLSGSATRMERLKETLDAKDAEIKRIKSASAQQRRIDELTAEKEALAIKTKAQIDALQREISQAKSEINNLNKQVIYRDNKLKQVETVFAGKLETELDQLKEEYEALLVESVDTIEELEGDLVESKEKVSELEDRLSERSMPDQF